jgi:hypothetical protein
MPGLTDRFMVNVVAYTDWRTRCLVKERPRGSGRRVSLRTCPLHYKHESQLGAARLALPARRPGDRRSSVSACGLRLAPAGARPIITQAGG